MCGVDGVECAYALFGLGWGGGLGEGDVVLVQGTGGVSVIAMQVSTSIPLRLPPFPGF